MIDSRYHELHGCVIGCQSVCVDIPFAPCWGSRVPSRAAGTVSVRHITCVLLLGGLTHFEVDVPLFSSSYSTGENCTLRPVPFELLLMTCPVRCRTKVQAEDLIVSE